MKKCGIILSLLVFLFNSGFPQMFRNPLDIPMYLSGSFAELRSNHFHSGLDIKTQGREGFPVFAVADGWVSRVKVSPWGFGHAVYITHNNGYTSVYAHLSRFNQAIDNYVIKQQYAKKSFAVDVYLKKGQIPVKGSDIVAYTGNTGGSGGPHLHFELRKTVSQKPINPLKFNFDIKDNLPPVLKKLSVSEYGKTIFYQIKKKNASTYFLDTLFVGSDTSKLAISISDYANGSRSPLGVNNIEMYIDGELVYHYKIESFAFNQSRYVNAHIDYGNYIIDKERFQKLYVENGNHLNAYPVQNKHFSFQDKAGKNVKILVSDSQGNTSVLEFVIKRKAGSLLDIPKQNGVLFSWNHSNKIKNDVFELIAPIGAFYSDFYLSSEVLEDVDYIGGRVLKIGEKTVPIHKKVNLNVTVPKEFKGDVSKLCLVQIEGKDVSAVDSRTEQKTLKAKIRSFGTFGIMQDTVPPQIKLKSKHPDYKEKAFVFEITDDLSGIDSYSASLNGDWILFKYDYKTNQYYYDRDFRLKKTGGQQRLKIKVVDAKGNINQKFVDFVY